MPESRQPTVRNGRLQIGIRMRWIGYVATILWWSGIARSLSSLNRGHSYKISPKPCRVPGPEGSEGTCMFVWECIKSEGTHVGVCVDTFMFGSCCVHNSTSNSINSQQVSSSNTLRPSLADALADEPTRPTLTSLSGLTQTIPSSSRPTIYSSASQNYAGSSSRPLKPTSSNLPRPSQKRPHAKPTSDQDNRLQSSDVLEDDPHVWDNGSLGVKRPQTSLMSHQQVLKTRPHNDDYLPTASSTLGNVQGHQGFKDKIDDTHNTLVIRLPSKNQAVSANKGQQYRPYRPGLNQRPSESRPDDSKTEDIDLTVQETIHRPSVNSVDGAEPAENSHPSLNFIHTESPQWATKPAASNKPTDYSKPYFSIKTTTTTYRPVGISESTSTGTSYALKPDNQNSPDKSLTTARPTYYSSQSTSVGGSVSQTVHWQVTTEPAFITKQRPSSTKPITILETTRPSSSSNHFWSENSWTPPKPSLKPHWTDNPSLLQNGPENFPHRPSFKPTESQENTEYHKPLGSAHYITTSYIETSTKPRPTKKTTTSTTTSTTTTTTTTTTPRPTTTTTTTTVSTSTTSETLPQTAFKSGNVQTVSAGTEGKDMPCGVQSPFPHPETRIVGGKDTGFGRWPWQVSVRRTSFFGFSSTHRCGGAVLNENWIATAGHCVDDLLTSQIRIRVGEYDFSSLQEPFPFVERGVAKKVVHPKYNFFTYEYDLALVKLESSLTFAPHIAPICLPAGDDLLIGENATVTGWGRLSEGGTLPSVLQEVSVPIVSNDKCKSMFLRAGRHEFIPDIFLCAGYESGGQDSCQGDSGGPLQVRGKDGRYFLAGIISWGIGCAEANLPGVCTRISKFVQWIQKNVT